MSVSSPDIVQFSNFCHQHTLWKVCNDVIVKHPTMRELRRYTTLLNISVKKTNNNCTQQSYLTCFLASFLAASRRIIVNSGEARETGFLYQRISVLMQRYNAVQRWKWVRGSWFMGQMGHHFWMGHVGRGSLPVTH